MTVYACHRCSDLYDRITSISSGNSVYYDSEVPLLEGGCAGCPQCVRNVCATCAEELLGICDCGGELVSGILYRLNVDGRLPQEITDRKTLTGRLESLSELKSSKRMIVATYRWYKMLIESTAEYSDKYDIEMPDNPGLYYLLEDSARIRFGLSPAEAWGFIAEYAVASNANEMLALFDSRCIQFVKETLDSYPHSESGWQDLARKFEADEYHPVDLVPYKSANEMMISTRSVIAVVREGLHGSGLS